MYWHFGHFMDGAWPPRASVLARVQRPTAAGWSSSTRRHEFGADRRMEWCPAPRVPRRRGHARAVPARVRQSRRPTARATPSRAERRPSPRVPARTATRSRRVPRAARAGRRRAALPPMLRLQSISRGCADALRRRRRDPSARAVRAPPASRPGLRPLRAARCGPGGRGLRLVKRRARRPT